MSDKGQTKKLRFRKWVEFLLIMTRKEINVRYKNAVFGFLWILLNPLFQMIIMGVIFHFFVPVQVDNYFLFLFSGLLPWNFFSSSLNKATSSFCNERALIKKAKFSKETIVLSIVLSNFFHFFIAMLLLLALLFFDKIFLEQQNWQYLLLYGVQLLLIVPVSLWLLVFVSALSLSMATLNVKYRDVAFMVSTLVSLWFYATPIIYSLNILPSEIRWFFYLNPLTIMTEIYHFALLNMSIEQLSLGGIALLITGLLVGISIKIFRKEEKYFDDWL